MKFVDRELESRRLQRLAHNGGLAVYGGGGVSGKRAFFWSGLNSMTDSVRLQISLHTLAKTLLTKGIPPVKGLRDKDLLHAVFLAEVMEGTPVEIDGVHVITGEQVFEEMR